MWDMHGGLAHGCEGCKGTNHDVIAWFVVYSYCLSVAMPSSHHIGWVVQVAWVMMVFDINQKDNRYYSDGGDSSCFSLGFRGVRITSRENIELTRNNAPLLSFYGHQVIAVTLDCVGLFAQSSSVVKLLG